MWFLYTLSWIATVLQVCFVTMAIAAGLYYLAELVEEFTAVAAKVLCGWFSLLNVSQSNSIFRFRSCRLQRTY